MGPAVQHLAERQAGNPVGEGPVVLHLALGDLFYGDITSSDPNDWLREYARILQGPQAAAYTSAPLVYTWDDHDFGPNDANTHFTGRWAAFEAWTQAVPHGALPPSATRTGAIYRSLVVQGELGIVVLDCRSQSSPSGGTLLGAEQLVWLEGELAGLAQNPDILGVFMMSSVPWIGNPADAGADEWAAYPEERAQVASWLQQDLLRNKTIVVLQGDAHMLALDDGSAEGTNITTMSVGALEGRPSVKGGPYSHGCRTQIGQFAELLVRREPNRLCVELRGISAQGDIVLGPYDTCTRLPAALSPEAAAASCTLRLWHQVYPEEYALMSILLVLLCCLATACMARRRCYSGLKKRRRQ